MALTTDLLADTYQEQTVASHYNSQENDNSNAELDDNEFLDLLDDEVAFAGYREQRKQELQNLMNTSKRNVNQGYGIVTHLTTEKEILDMTTTTEFSIVHFSHPDFLRCKIMTQKLENLAPRHLETRFVQINAQDAPFLVSKLNVRVLPCVMGFINGHESLRLVGFEQLGGGATDFDINLLEQRLASAGVIRRVSAGGTGHSSSSIFKFSQSKQCDDGELSEDD